MKKTLLKTLKASLIISAIGLAYLIWAAPASTEKLRLHLSVQNTPVRSDEFINGSISITNDGNRPVTLVAPGDGSDVGWRTPIIKWVVSKIRNDNEESSTPESEETIYRCGNINAFGLEDVFILYPGETREITEWIGEPKLHKPGTYKVKLLYENDPSMEWKGVPLGIHNPLAMLWAKNSTSCKLESNETIVEVRGE